MLARSPIEDAEEWAIHDYEGFAGVYISEYTGFEKVHALAHFIEEYQELGATVLECTDGDVKRVIQLLDGQYHGLFTSVEAFAQELTEETNAIPEYLVHYIDYAAMARDMQLNGDIFALQTTWEEIHIFWGS